MAEVKMQYSQDKTEQDLVPENQPQPDSFIEKLRAKIGGYQLIKDDDRIKFLKVQFQKRADEKLPYYVNNHYLLLVKDASSLHFFGFDPEVGTLQDDILVRCRQETGISPLMVATQVFETVVIKCAELRNQLEPHLVAKGETRRGFPFRITKQKNFSVPSFGGGGETVGFGEDYLYAIARALIDKNESALQAVLASMAAQFFHEQLHQLCGEDSLDTGVQEEMSLMGEFLYDPEHDVERNAVFKQMNGFALNEAAAQQSGQWSESYDRPWQKVGLVILIHELISLGLVPHDDKITEEVIPQLPMYYAQLSEEQRMNILKKYLVLKKTDLYEHCHRLAVEHKLSFAV
jgi:hypothetical protein